MLSTADSNWSSNLAIPISEWDYDSSCCRDTIIILRIVELINILIATTSALLYFLILNKTRIVHINLRVLLITMVMTDLALLYIRIFDIINFSGRFEDNINLLFLRFTCWVLGIVLLPSIIFERIYAVRHYRMYGEVSIY
ncbi:hypothetical protein PFISCL1PPCAC_13555, partial [Pristionchus fissidentatus]